MITISYGYIIATLGVGFLAGFLAGVVVSAIDDVTRRPKF